MDIKQNTPEWLELRKNYLGASDAPIVMGVSPWKTPYKLWQEKLGFGEEHHMSFHMQRGLDLEPKARDFFEQTTGFAIYPEVVIHPTIDYLMASIDGMTEDRETIVEIKCPGPTDHSLAKKGIVPTKYYPQMQHQMEVCQVLSMYYLSFDGKDGAILTVDRDDQYISKMLQKHREFWECVQTFSAPELCERDYQERTDDIWLETASEWSELQEKIRVLQDRENELRRTFNSMSEGSNCSGGGVKVSKVIRKGCVDYALIPELIGVDVEKYRRKPTEFLKITNLPF